METDLETMLEGWKLWKDEMENTGTTWHGRESGSKLGKVINALKSNNDAVIVGTIGVTSEDGTEPGPEFRYRSSEDFDIVVAPKTGLLKKGRYTPEALEEFVSKLTTGIELKTGLKPDRFRDYDDVREYFSGTGIRYEHLVPVYSEPISKVKKTDIETVEILEGGPKTLEVVRETNEEIKREVRITAYGDVKLARAFFEKWTETQITGSFPKQGWETKKKTVEGITYYVPHVPRFGGW